MRDTWVSHQLVGKPALVPIDTIEVQPGWQARAVASISVDPQNSNRAYVSFGGFNTQIAGRSFYLIQVAEKQICWLKATVRGPGGHGAYAHRGGTVARLGRLLRALDRKRLPVHVRPA